MSQWRYPAPFDIYNGDPNGDTAVMRRHEPDGSGYYAIEARSGEFLGYVCFGPEACVQGQVARDDIVDLGAGLAPEVLSRGLMKELLPQVLDFAAQRFPAATTARAVVAAFNERSLRACRGAGFVDAAEILGPGDRPFIELERPLPANPVTVAVEAR